MLAIYYSYVAAVYHGTGGTMTELEYFQTFSKEYLEDLKKLDEKEIHILDFAKKYNLLWGSKSNPKVKANVLNDLTAYKKYKDLI